MRVPLSWLKDYVEIKESQEKLAEDLLLSGTKVESIESTADDSVLEFEITPNRADCLSILGIAREVAAIYNRKLIIPPVFSENLKPPTKGREVVFQVTDQRLCPAYTFAVIDSIKVGPSPDWLAARLEKSGIRSINNIVDVTNYVMLETGQPMHAFDFAKISGKMTLRSSKTGERIHTLDKVERVLPAGAIIIEDGEKIIDLAGLMGGQSSEVDENTTSIVLHVPVYDPLAIRHTSLLLGLRTEASNRFEKQLDPDAHRFAFERAAFLILEFAQGSLASEIKSVGYNPNEHQLKIPTSLIKQTLGIQITEREVIEVLSRLEFATTVQNNVLKVLVPTFRTDIKEPIDIVEEIARVYGYNKLPKTLPAGEVPKEDLASSDFEKEIKQVFASAGLMEIYSSPLTSGEIIDSLSFRTEECLRVANRSVIDYEYLRPTLLAGLLLAAQSNQENFNQFYLFEMGKIFEKKEPADKLPLQPNKIAALFFNSNFTTSKGVAEGIFNKLNVENARFTPSAEASFFTQPVANIYLGDSFLGKIGRIKSETLAKFDINLPSFGFELDIETLQLHSSPRHYQPIPKFPTVKENISLFLPKKVTFDDASKAIKTAASKNYHSLELLEDKIIGGQRSILVGVEYYNPSHTLNKKEIESIRQHILKELQKIGAKPRTAQL